MLRQRSHATAKTSIFALVATIALALALSLQFVGPLVDEPPWPAVPTPPVPTVLQGGSVPSLPMDE